MTGGGGCDWSEPGSHCPGMTDGMYRTFFSILCVTASPLIVATDLRNMTGIMKQVGGLRARRSYMPRWDYCNEDMMWYGR
jgi:hypothetical protein